MQLRFTVGGKKRFLTVQTKAQEQYYILQLSILRFEWGYKINMTIRRKDEHCKGMLYSRCRNDFLFNNNLPQA